MGKDLTHEMVVASEPEDYGDRGTTTHVRSSRRVWISECSCGWHAGSGVGYTWFRLKRDAVAAWRAHEARSLVGYEDRLHRMRYVELMNEARRVHAQIFSGITRPILIGRILERQGIDDSILANPDQEEK